MKVIINIRKINTMIVDNMFYIFNFLAIISTFFYKYQTGVVCSIIILLMFILNWNNICGIMRDYLFVAFIAINILSLSVYFVNQQPMTLLFSALTYNLIPSLLYAFGASFDEERFERIANKIYISNLIIMGIGLFFLFFFRSYYFTVMDERYAAYNHIAFRFGSYLSSLPFGSMCMAQVGLFFFRILTEKKHLITFLSIPIILVSLFQSMERGAWIASGIVLAGSLFVILRKRMSWKKLLGIFIAAAVIIVTIRVVFGNLISDTQMAYFFDRLDNTDAESMIGSRAYQWEDAINVFMDYPILGYGLGTAGNKASNYGTHLVPDGNYFRILVEIGIFGFILFIVLLVRNIYNGFKGGKEKAMLISVILLGFALHAIGSNVFDYFYSSFIFWMFLGFLNKKRYRGALNERIGNAELQ